MRSFVQQALRDGFFHADMHQGNLFVDAQGRLVAVDFGIMGRLDRTMRRFMAETLAGFLARDYERVAQVHFDVGFVPPHHPLETFAQALRAIGEPIFGKSVRDLSMARLLQQLFERHAASTCRRSRSSCCAEDDGRGGRCRAFPRSGFSTSGRRRVPSSSAG